MHPTQGINITGGNAPGTTSVGGLVTIKSGAQLMREDRQKAEQENTAPLVQGLAAYIRQAWSQARSAKEMQVEPRMLQSVRQRRGQYSPEKEAQLAQQNSSMIYMMLTSNKCRAASSWLRDVLLVTSDDKPWTISPTPVPEIDPMIMQQVMAQVTQAVTQMHDQGMDPSVDEVRQLLANGKDMAMSHIKDLANRSCERMEDKMQDQLLEGGWIEAFSDFIDDLTTFPAAIMKGPVIRKRPKIKWIAGQNGTYELQVEDGLSLEWERVDPFMAYPAPGSAGVNDGDFIERHRLQRSDLTALIGVEGYSDNAIRAVLDQYG